MSQVLLPHFPDEDNNTQWWKKQGFELYILLSIKVYLININLQHLPRKDIFLDSAIKEILTRKKYSLLSIPT